MDARALAAMPLESPAWQRIAERFRAPLDALHEHGVLAWLRQWLRQDGAAVRLQALADGRRRLTDLRHLAELLELEWRRTRSVVQVTDWLDARIDAAAQEKEETRLLRLDSDEGLIRIRTLHGAKGLEYAVVFLPFQWTGRSDDRAVLHEPVPAPGSGHRAYVDLSGSDLSGSDEAAMAHAVLAEDLRLLYVGLTRARRACYVGIARGSTSGKQVPLLQTALGHLLFDAEQADDFASLRRQLDALADGTPEIAVTVLPPEAGDPPVVHGGTEEQPGVEPMPAARLQVVTTFAHVIPDRWRISSYSSMVAGRHALEPTPGVADEPELETIPTAAHTAGTGARAFAAEPDEAAPGEALAGPASASGIRPVLPFHLRFPRGPAAGSLLHDVLERWDHEGDRRQRVDALVRAHGFARAGDDERIDLDALLAWLARVRETPLAPLVPAGMAVEPPTLASLVLHAEVEFAMPLRGGDSTALDAVLRRHGYVAEPLGAQRWQGLLKGFMDVVFAWQGRYVVLDYKSNHLGDDASCYAGEALLDAMRAHRYELQLLIYAVALRRWLRRRGVADARPMGLYWFLRGIDAPGAGLWHHEPSVAVLDELDAVFDGEGVA
jgi:exodeoxyribonuclease V beta subunit